MPRTTEPRRGKPYMAAMSWAAFAAAVLCCWLVLPASQALAQDGLPAMPLLIEGKQSLYQRVITHPGATVFQEPDPGSEIVRATVKPFTVFYVYERREAEGEEWLAVGPSTGGALGWLLASRASEWNQALTLVYTERTGRNPVLFFRSYDELETAARADNPQSLMDYLKNKFHTIQAGEEDMPEDFPLTAMEEVDQAVPRDHFYIMPIFDVAEPAESVKFLEVASINPGDQPRQMVGSLKTGIVFVIDTTISMGPYIERTREVVRSIYDEIEAKGLEDRVGFGLVGFRSSTEATPGVEYVSKVYSDIRDAGDREAFEAALDSMREAPVSTHAFNEDAFAGIETALNDLDWGPYASRLVFLITDAGAIRTDDPYSTTGLNEGEMAQLARAHGVSIFALHLRTPAGEANGRNNHAYAQAQYETLTGQDDPEIGNLYIPIDTSGADAGVGRFGDVISSIADQMIRLVRATSAGVRMPAPDYSAPTEDPFEAALRKAEALGYAMQLDYLGRRGGVQAPEVVVSWVSDKDLARPDTPSFQICVLLSKTQLSDLQQRLKIVLDESQRTKRTGARDFFEAILNAAAQLSRDPMEFSRDPGRNLSELGVLGEFLEDLPYRSPVMRLTEDDWYRMSVGEQQAFIDTLKSKIRAYQAFHDDVANWEAFGADNPGDAVYRVPLSMLP